MATGDLSGNIQRLFRELKSVKYSLPPDEVGLRLGDPVAYLPIMNFTLLRFSKHVAFSISKCGYELIGKTDQRFVECTFKLARDMFGIRTVITSSQFLEQGYAERKVLFLFDLIQACKKLHNDEARKERLAAVKKQRKSVDQASLSPADRGVKVIKNKTETDSQLTKKAIPYATDAAQEQYEVHCTVIKAATGICKPASDSSARSADSASPVNNKGSAPNSQHSSPVRGGWLAQVFAANDQDVTITNDDTPSTLPATSLGHPLTATPAATQAAIPHASSSPTHFTTNPLPQSSIPVTAPATSHLLSNTSHPSTPEPMPSTSLPPPHHISSHSNSPHTNGHAFPHNHPSSTSSSSPTRNTHYPSSPTHPPITSPQQSHPPSYQPYNGYSIPNGHHPQEYTHHHHGINGHSNSSNTHYQHPNTAQHSTLKSEPHYPPPHTLPPASSTPHANGHSTVHHAADPTAPPPNSLPHSNPHYPHHPASPQQQPPLKPQWQYSTHPQQPHLQQHQYQQSPMHIHHEQHQHQHQPQHDQQHPHHHHLQHAQHLQHQNQQAPMHGQEHVSVLDDVHRSVKALERRLAEAEAELQRSRTESSRVQDSLQARVTILEGRVRFLEGEMKFMASRGSRSSPTPTATLPDSQGQPARPLQQRLASPSAPRPSSCQSSSPRDPSNSSSSTSLTHRTHTTHTYTAAPSAAEQPLPRPHTSPLQSRPTHYNINKTSAPPNPPSATAASTEINPQSYNHNHSHSLHQHHQSHSAVSRPWSASTVSTTAPHSKGRALGQLPESHDSYSFTAQPNAPAAASSPVANTSVHSKVYSGGHSGGETGARDIGGSVAARPATGYSDHRSGGSSPQWAVVSAHQHQAAPVASAAGIGQPQPQEQFGTTQDLIKNLANRYLEAQHFLKSLKK